MMKPQMPYLESIQALPGNTPGEKYRNMASFIRNKIQQDKNVKFNESLGISRALLPLVQIEAAKIQKKHDVVTESLKSNDSVIVHRALQAHWYFNGSVKDVVNIKYLKQHLLPCVSLSARFKVIKTFAFQLYGKDHSFAEELFQTVLEMYGVKQAVPLLIACSESFAYNAVVENRLVLPRNILKQFYSRNPNFVIRYLKLGKPSQDSTRHCILLHEYEDFFLKLVKRHLNTFVEISESLNGLTPLIRLSKKRATVFLKNGKDHLIKNPSLYINMIPKKLISADLMQVLLPKLLPKRKDFDVDNVFSMYLSLFSDEEKVLLLKKAFKEVYDEELLAKSATVKPQLLRILPAEERIAQARMKIKEDQPNDTEFCYRNVWRCYLTTKESIPLIQKDISATSDTDARGRLLQQLIYTCKVNNDENALLEVLNYFMRRHKNENIHQHVQFYETLLKEFDILSLKKTHHAVLNKWLRLHCVPKNCSYISNQFLEHLIHFRLDHGEPIQDFIKMYVEKQLRAYFVSWNIIRTKPEYERQCLLACIDSVSKTLKNIDNWQKNYGKIVKQLVKSIYDFNERHTKAPSKVQRLSIKDHSWLLNATKIIMKTLPSDDQKAWKLFTLIRRKENNLLLTLIPEEKRYFILKEELNVLRKNPQSVLNNWKHYFVMCKSDWSGSYGSVQFLRALRWHKDIPINFCKVCMYSFPTNKDIKALFILSVLLDGNSFANLIKPHVSDIKWIDSDSKDADCNMSYFLTFGMRLSNPPVPLSLVKQFCDEEYTGNGLSCLTDVCRRTPVPDVIAFAKKLVNERVALRSHRIRLLYLVETVGEVKQFLTTQWRVEKNADVRKVLFDYVEKFFHDNPGPAGWSLTKNTISALTFEYKYFFSTFDEDILTTAIVNVTSISVQYLKDYIVLLLETIDKLSTSYRIAEFKIELFRVIDCELCDSLPEDFRLDLLRKFLFSYESESMENFGEFVIMSYLRTDEEKLRPRMAAVCAVFRENVKAHWDQPHPRLVDHCPVNYAVYIFVRILICAMWERNISPFVLESFFEAFNEVLTPHQDPDSYLNLVYARIYVESQSPKEFSRKLVEKLPELIDTFSPVLLILMGGVLLDFFNDNPCKDTRNEIMLKVTDGLLETQDVNAYFLATVLYDPDKKNLCLPTYERIIKAFRKCGNVAVRSIISCRMNRIDYETGIYTGV